MSMLPLQAGLEFSLFSDFERIWQEHQFQNHVTFIISSCKKLARENSLARDLKYEFVKYTCSQGPKQNQVGAKSTGRNCCNASMRLVLVKSIMTGTHVLKIKHVCLEHKNHTNQDTPPENSTRVKTKTPEMKTAAIASAFFPPVQTISTEEFRSFYPMDSQTPVSFSMPTVSSTPAVLPLSPCDLRVTSHRPQPSTAYNLWDAYQKDAKHKIDAAAVAMYHNKNNNNNNNSSSKTNNEWYGHFEPPTTPPARYRIASAITSDINFCFQSMDVDSFRLNIKHLRKYLELIQNHSPIAVIDLTDACQQVKMI